MVVTCYVTDEQYTIKLYMLQYDFVTS